MTATTSAPSFRRTFLRVALAHFILLVLLALAPWPKKENKEPYLLEMINLAPSPHPAPIPSPSPTPAPAPAQSSAPPPPTPPVPEAVPETVTPPIETAVPVAESRISLVKKSSPPKLRPETTLKTSPPEKPVQLQKREIKVNLNVVERRDDPVAKTRTQATAATKKFAQSSSAQTGPDAATLAQRLGGALTGSGATESVGVNGSAGGGGGADAAWYYGLIKEQMDGAWDQPTELAGRGLRAQIQIVVAKDGTIKDCSVLLGSGNYKFDQSALAAARKVGKIRKPRPDNLPEAITITFKFTE